MAGTGELDRIRARIVGHGEPDVDADDFVRHQELIGAPDPAEERPPIRSFAPRLAELYQGEEASFEDGEPYLGEIRRPVDDERRILINYMGPSGTFPRVSLSDFLAAASAWNEEHVREWVEGKAVLLGPDNIGDRHATPFYTMFSGARGNTAGVEIHASKLLTGDFPCRPCHSGSASRLCCP